MKFTLTLFLLSAQFTLTLCRLYAGPYHQEEIKISESKSFTLINMPYCLTGMLSAYIESYMAIKERG